MMKQRKNWKTLTGLAFLFMLFGSFTNKDQQKLTLKMTMQMPGDNGTNGAGVVYNSQAHVYYAAFAGNADFPIATFNEFGTLMPSTLETTGADLRSMWYNKGDNCLMALCYDNGGLVKYGVDNQGVLNAVPINLISGMLQPDAQSCGGYSSKNNCIYFLSTNNMKIQKWSTGKGAKKLKTIQLKGFSMEDSYNNVVAYTGIKGKEFALLNVSKNRIDYYGEKKGNFHSSTILSDLDYVPSTSLNFSYANNIFWIFDIENRTWKGYQ